MLRSSFASLVMRPAVTATARLSAVAAAAAASPTVSSHAIAATAQHPHHRQQPRSSSGRRRSAEAEAAAAEGPAPSKAQRRKNKMQSDAAHSNAVAAVLLGDAEETLAPPHLLLGAHQQQHQHPQLRVSTRWPQSEHHEAPSRPFNGCSASPFNAFVRAMAKQDALAGYTPRDFSKLCSILWGNLSADDKDRWRVHAAQESVYARFIEQQEQQRGVTDAASVSFLSAEDLDATFSSTRMMSPRANASQRVSESKTAAARSFFNEHYHRVNHLPVAERAYALQALFELEQSGEEE